MKTELKGWLADNTVTTDNKEDKILVLESAGNLTLSDVLDEMKKEDTGLRAETLKHAVDLFQRTVSELVLNGYSVNTGLFRAVPPVSYTHLSMTWIQVLPRYVNIRKPIRTLRVLQNSIS